MSVNDDTLADHKRYIETDLSDASITNCSVITKFDGDAQVYAELLINGRKYTGQPALIHDAIEEVKNNKIPLTEALENREVFGEDRI